MHQIAEYVQMSSNPLPYQSVTTAFHSTQYLVRNPHQAHPLTSPSALSTNSHAPPPHPPHNLTSPLPRTRHITPPPSLHPYRPGPFSPAVIVSSSDDGSRPLPNRTCPSIPLCKKKAFSVASSSNPEGWKAQNLSLSRRTAWGPLLGSSTD